MQMQKKKTAVWPWLLVAVVVIGAGWWLFRKNLPGGDETPAATTAPAPPAAALPPPDAKPATVDAQQPPPIQHPIDSSVAADAAVPALKDSDAEAWDALVKIVGSEQPLAVVLRDHLIQRVVTMIDNLTETRVTRRSLALQPLPGSLQVSGEAGSQVIAETNAQRYAPYVQAFTQADPQVLVAAYKRFYPLFQQAYVELGYPKRYFNDRLVEVIDHLLQAPQPTKPPLVEADDRGHYRFVDPSLESLSIGQKALLRLAPEQESAVKKQLTAIRAALTRT